MQSSTHTGQDLRVPLLSTGNGGERSETEWTGDNNGTAIQQGPAAPDPEVVAQARRRSFTKEYKISIIEEADRCKKTGEIGALLRREGLYSSHLRNWRRERKQSALTAMQAKQRGPKPKRDPQHLQILQLERENKRLQTKLQQAETILEIQKKVSELLGLPLAESDGSDS